MEDVEMQKTVENPSHGVRYSPSVHGEPPEGVEVLWGTREKPLTPFCSLRMPHTDVWMRAPEDAPVSEQPPFPLSREEWKAAPISSWMGRMPEFYEWFSSSCFNGNYDEAESAWRAAGCPGATSSTPVEECEINKRELVFAFASWLSALPETLRIGASEECSDLGELAGRFCDHYGLPPTETVPTLGLLPRHRETAPSVEAEPDAPQEGPWEVVDHAGQLDLRFVRGPGRWRAYAFGESASAFDRSNFEYLARLLNRAHELEREVERLRDAMPTRSLLGQSSLATAVRSLVAERDELRGRLGSTQNTLHAVLRDTAKELDCAADNEVILQAISDLKEQVPLDPPTQDDEIADLRKRLEKAEDKNRAADGLVEAIRKACASPSEGRG